jgi:hypothetical protein
MSPFVKLDAFWRITKGEGWKYRTQKRDYCQMRVLNKAEHAYKNGINSMFLC